MENLITSLIRSRPLMNIPDIRLRSFLTDISLLEHKALEID
jgi:hypothetical protein